jgi:glycerol-3-phosphate O-acyltransferase
MNYLTNIDLWKEKKAISPTEHAVLKGLYQNYLQACQKSDYPEDKAKDVLNLFLCLTEEQIKSPFNFPPFHKRITSPTNYYQFALDFVAPLIQWKNSYLDNESNVEIIEQYLAKNENVVLFANHQIEPDPQILSLLLQDKFPQLAKDIIFLAGDRVTSDPISIPFSLGTNLLCIYSKKYIDSPPEDKERKLLHNKKTMQVMKELFEEGSKCIYVAPSGGRDRKNADGIVEIAPFDPQSIELFYLIAARAKTPTHFFPLSLNTYELLPPPASIQVELGEQREINYEAVQASFGKEIQEKDFFNESSKLLDKRELRKIKTTYIQNEVEKNYRKLLSI